MMAKAKITFNDQSGAGVQVVRIDNVTDFNSNESFLSLRTPSGLTAFATRTILRVELTEDGK